MEETFSAAAGGTCSAVVSATEDGALDEFYGRAPSLEARKPPCKAAMAEDDRAEWQMLVVRLECGMRFLQDELRRERQKRREADACCESLNTEPSGLKRQAQDLQAQCNDLRQLSDKLTEEIALLQKEMEDLQPKEPPQPPSAAYPEDSDTALGPYPLPLSVLLEYLTVSDMVNWRVTSWQAKDPKALVQHVVEVGNFRRPSSAIAFAEMMGAISAAYAKAPDAPKIDVNMRYCQDRIDCTPKLYKEFWCQLWHLTQADRELWHFPGSDVTVAPSLVRDLLEHCGSTDPALASAGFLCLNIGLAKGMPELKQTTAAGMLRLLKSSQLKCGWKMKALRLLGRCIGSMSITLRQEGLSLLMEMLRLETDVGVRQCVISKLDLLWRAAAEDPSDAWEEAERQLRQLCQSVPQDVRVALEAILLFD
ncbi:AMT1-1 [Symbiodinium natans]|uniref:AMT1-1 protein n=1 Tax=Symbiodinium natans TaxID=878477 RepID=A0A812VB13_9DINO|nr:AMT1-1 [Symbiodinium natans]